MSEEQYFEGLWDCPNCDTTNTGSDMSCKGCGAVRDEDVKFYLPENAKEITDDKELESAKSGPDWVCGYCSTSNVASAQSCKQCAGPREDGQNREVTEVGGDKKPKDDSNVPKAKPAESGPSSPMPMIIAVVALLLMASCCWIMLFKTTTEAATITAVGWERKVDIEGQRWQEEFSERKPRLSRDVRRIRRDWKKIKKSVTEKVPVKKTVTKNLGNGRFKKETKTVMESKTTSKLVRVEGWSYERLSWVVERTELARGSANDPPKWPDVRLSRGQRQGRKVEVLFVDFKNKGGDLIKMKNGDVAGPKSIDELKKYKVGDKYEISYSGKDGVKKLKKL